MFEVLKMPKQLPAELLEVALTAEPATIGHFRLFGFPSPSIRPLVPVERTVGTAVTLALAGADSALLHHAAGYLRKGDFLVIDRLGDTVHAALGGGVATVLSRIGVAGVIIDGPCADPGEIADSGLPVWCTGVSALTTRVYGNAGAMNRPVSIGGAVVMPGDLIVADQGGIVVLPPQEAEADLLRAVKLQEWEKENLSVVTQGKQLGELSGASRLVLERTANAR